MSRAPRARRGPRRQAAPAAAVTAPGRAASPSVDGGAARPRSSAGGGAAAEPSSASRPADGGESAAPHPPFDTTSRSARISQVISALVVAVVSVIVMVPTHRLSIDLGGLALPVGLLFGALFQTVASVFLWASTGSRLPVVLLACAWGLLVMPLAGTGPGGGVLMPAMLGDQMQYSGWIVQALGVFIPFIVCAVVTVQRLRRVPRAS